MYCHVFSRLTCKSCGVVLLVLLGFFTAKRKIISVKKYEKFKNSKFGNGTENLDNHKNIFILFYIVLNSFLLKSFKKKLHCHLK